MLNIQYGISYPSESKESEVEAKLKPERQKSHWPKQRMQPTPPDTIFPKE